MSSWLLVCRTKAGDRVGVSTVDSRQQCMRQVVDAFIKERNEKKVRGRSDWYCLCVVHGFGDSSRFSAAALRRELASTIVASNLGPTHSVLAKIDKVLSKNAARSKGVQLVF